MHIQEQIKPDLPDYKIFNFNGKPGLIEYDFDRFVDHKRNLYGPDWNLINAELEYRSDKKHNAAKPEQLEKMLELASRLAEGTRFLRTDFYIVSGRVYFGEMTFFPDAGMGEFRPEEWDARLGKLIKLPNGESSSETM